jgi:hypothetical protein
MYSEGRSSHSLHGDGEEGGEEGGEGGEGGGGEGGGKSGGAHGKTAKYSRSYVEPLSTRSFADLQQ